MRYILFFFLSFSFFISNGQTTQGPKNGAVIGFPITSHDFGDIIQGDKVSFVFKYKNTGTEPLIINEVLTTCGCTATEWSKTPLAPGEIGSLSASFNSEGKMGRQNKVITILSNATNNAATISLVCNVLPSANSTK
ncbi:MAG: DUF1573 domain-containing protein [Cytophagales bacterium]|nr:MAG: DUF1573 domain-containing protein [Cytophagales bacterium]